MNRRGFLAGILAAAVAPAIVRADSLMRIVPLDTILIAPSASQVLAAELLAKADADAAFAAGLQLREWLAHDIVTDRMFMRYDVIGRGLDDKPVQLGVDFDGGTVAENREIARTMLAGELRREGATPVRNLLKLPNGASFV